jgi:hypothetical protein
MGAATFRLMEELPLPSSESSLDDIAAAAAADGLAAATAAALLLEGTRTGVRAAAGDGLPPSSLPLSLPSAFAAVLCTTPMERTRTGADDAKGTRTGAWETDGKRADAGVLTSVFDDATLLLVEACKRACSCATMLMLSSSSSESSLLSWE